MIRANMLHEIADSYYRVALHSASMHSHMVSTATYWPAGLWNSCS